MTISCTPQSTFVTNMADNYQLWCLIEGDNRPFLIITPHSTTISQVKQLIIQQCPNHILQGVESCNLILKKVSYNMSSGSSQI